MTFNKVQMEDIVQFLQYIFFLSKRYKNEMIHVQSNGNF